MKIPQFLAACVAALLLTACSQESNPEKTSTNTPPSEPFVAKKPSAPAAPKIKFRVQEIADQGQKGLVAFRLAVPEDWRAQGRIEWHYNDLYVPVHSFGRAESPDGSAWVEYYPAELFYWLDPRWDNMPGGGSVGGVHHANIKIQDAMARYIVARYRGKEKNLKILGARPVKNLAQAMHRADATGEGICMRVRYELNGEPVDEEFYGQMSPIVTIPYTGPQGTTYEYHRSLQLVHSLGAKSAKLEPNRSLLGFIATSVEVDKFWQDTANAVYKQMLDQYNQLLAAGYARIQAAAQLSRTISANNDAMIRAMDQQRAAANARTTTAGGSSEGVYHAVDNFDQYIRDTETVQDSNGQTTEVSNQYNYHWTDGFGTVVSSNDPSFDPNQTSPTHYDPLKKVR